MGKPLVSIIIPVYNAGKHLAQCIESAIDQTWPNKEIIIVDDESADNSLEIARQYECDWIKVFQQENKGAGATRNKGLKEAKGEYIQFLDADDLLSNNKIELQMEQLVQNPDKIAVCQTVHFMENESPFSGVPSAYESSFLYSTDEPAEFLINLYGGYSATGSMIQTNAWLTPVSLIKKAGPWLEFYNPDDDGEFFCRMVLASNGVIFEPRGFNYYRKFQTNHNLAAHTSLAALEGKFKSLVLKKEYLAAATTDELWKTALSKSAIELAVASYPVYKSYTKKVQQFIKQLGGTKYIPVVGGGAIEIIKKIFGWKLARYLQYYYAKIKYDV